MIDNIEMLVVNVSFVQHFKEDKMMAKFVVLIYVTKIKSLFLVAHVVHVHLNK